MPSRRGTWLVSETMQGELERAVLSFGRSAGTARGELLAAMRWVSVNGSHPSELRPRGPVRALPAFAEPAAALYILFAVDGDNILALHFANVLDITAARGEYVGLPAPLSETAWDLARDRLRVSRW